MSALDYRGRQVPSSYAWRDTQSHLAFLAEQYPVGARVVHEGGREGTVAPDQPCHVPGMFGSRSTAVCLAGQFHETPMVFVSWDNADGLVWRAWAPIAKVRRTAVPAVNRPGNRATVDRSKAGAR